VQRHRPRLHHAHLEIAVPYRRWVTAASTPPPGPASTPPSHGSDRREVVVQRRTVSINPGCVAECVRERDYIETSPCIFYKASYCPLQVVGELRWRCSATGRSHGRIDARGSNEERASTVHRLTLETEPALVVSAAKGGCRRRRTRPGNCAWRDPCPRPPPRRKVGTAQPARFGLISPTR
jgi:hypothetical protein